MFCRNDQVWRRMPGFHRRDLGATFRKVLPESRWSQTPNVKAHRPICSTKAATNSCNHLAHEMLAKPALTHASFLVRKSPSARHSSLPSVHADMAGSRMLYFLSFAHRYSGLDCIGSIGGGLVFIASPSFTFRNRSACNRGCLKHDRRPCICMYLFSLAKA